VIAVRVRGRLVSLVLGATASVVLLWLAVDANTRRACAVMDAGHELLCPQSPTGSGEDRASLLRRRIADNPGDSQAYVALAQFSGRGNEKVLAAATTLAPNNPNVLRQRALLDIEQGRLQDAIASLLLFVQHYDYLDKEPAKILARLVVQGHAPSIARHLRPDARWVDPLLIQLEALKLPIAPALPIVSTASDQGVLSAARLAWYLRTLKAQGHWVEAYGLWVGQHGRPLPTLYNGDFDREFRPDGFDWEVAPSPPGRAGAVAAARPSPGRAGKVLEVLYTGRSMPTPVVRQHLFVAPGRYRLTGHYMTEKLRSEGGLAWAARCMAPGTQAPAGRTTALPDSRGAWLPFSFEFEVTAQCGAVVSLQLETFAPFESETGIRGQAFFDAFQISRIVPP
jgi:hypothetical protein